MLIGWVILESFGTKFVIANRAVASHRLPLGSVFGDHQRRVNPPLEHGVILTQKSRRATFRVITCVSGHFRNQKARHRRPTAHARARYRCFLPDLAGLAGVRRAGPMPDLFDFSIPIVLFPFATESPTIDQAYI